MGCERPITPTNIPNDSNFDLKHILKVYAKKGKPLASINFNQALHPEWVQNDFLILRHIVEEANPNLYRYASKKTIDRFFEQKMDLFKDSITYFEFTQHIAEFFNTMAC